MVSPAGASRRRATFIPFSYHFRSRSPTSPADHPFVASILISEPNAEVRALLELLVARLGHRPLRAEDLENGTRPELMLLEPASSAGVELAKRLQVPRRRLGGDDAVAAPLEHLVHERPHDLLVLDEEDRLGAAKLGGVVNAAADRRRLLVHTRQVDLERRAAALLRVHRQVAAAL